MTAGDHLEHVEITSAHTLRAWLTEHHDQQAGVWIVTWKKHVPDRHVTREQVLDQLVAFGWTDGIARRIDDDRTRQLVSPRRTRPWAKSYKDRAERLIAEGHMHLSGLAAAAQHPPLDRFRAEARDAHRAHRPHRHRRPAECAGEEPWMTPRRSSFSTGRARPGRAVRPRPGGCGAPASPEPPRRDLIARARPLSRPSRGRP